MAFKLGVLFLSAGYSRRMGHDKFDLRIQGNTWIQHQLDVLEKLKAETPQLELEIDSMIVCRPEHRARLQRFSLEKKLELVENPLIESEKWESILLGLSKNREKENQVVLVCPIDVPLTSETISRLIEGFQGSTLVPEFAGQKGHPVLLSRDSVDRFLLQPRRLDYFLRDEAVETLQVSDSKILLNLNTPEKWQEYLKLQAADEPTV